ncbi:MAG: N-acetyltransferase family protein [Blastocatellia bacterium]
MSISTPFRPLTSRDEPLLRDMLYYAVFVPPGRDPWPRDVIDRPEVSLYVREWGRAGDAGLAAVDQVTNQDVGATWIRLFTAAAPGYGYVADDIPELSIALAPGHRGQGLGAALLESLFTLAAPQYSALSLSVSPQNAALRLYERLGFRQVADHGLAITMLKPLR